MDDEFAKCPSGRCGLAFLFPQNRADYDNQIFKSAEISIRRAAYWPNLATPPATAAVRSWRDRSGRFGGHGHRAAWRPVKQPTCTPPSAQVHLGFSGASDDRLIDPNPGRLTDLGLVGSKTLLPFAVIAAAMRSSLDILLWDGWRGLLSVVFATLVSLAAAFSFARCFL